MKRILPTSLILLALITAVCAWAAWQQARQRAQAQSRLAEAQLTAADAAAHAAAAEEEEKRDRRALTSLRDANAQLADKVLESRREQRAGPTNDPARSSDGATPAPALARVLREPEMKETMRWQASNEVRRALKQVITSNLVERLGLNREQAASLHELATRKGLLGFEFMMPVMTGELDEGRMAELGRRTKLAMSEADGQIRALLGEEGFRAFQQAERSQPDRDRVAELTGKLEGSDQPLSPPAQEQLTTLLSEERARFPFTTDYNDTAPIDFEHFREYYAPERMEVYFDELGQLNQRIVERARALLTSDQLAELDAALAEHLKKSKYVIKTTNALFGKGAAAAAAVR